MRSSCGSIRPQECAKRVRGKNPDTMYDMLEYPVMYGGWPEYGDWGYEVYEDVVDAFFRDENEGDKG